MRIVLLSPLELSPEVPLGAGLPEPETGDEGTFGSLLELVEPESAGGWFEGALGGLLGGLFPEPLLLLPSPPPLFEFPLSPEFAGLLVGGFPPLLGGGGEFAGGEGEGGGDEGGGGGEAGGDA